MKKQTTIILTAAAAALSWFGIRSPVSGGPAEPPSSGLEALSAGPSALVGKSASTSGSGLVFGETQVSHLSLTGRQEISFGGLTPDTLYVHNFAGPHESSPTEVFEVTASFDIVFARGKTKDHFYVLGQTASGEDVLERWKRGNVLGPGAPYVLKRKELYRGKTLNGVRALGLDHAARYLLVVHDDPAKLSKVPLPTGGAPTLLYDSAAIPELDMDGTGLNSYLYPRMHAVDGLVWTLQGYYQPNMPEQTWVLFYDTEDDGVIDSWNVFPSEEAYLLQYSIGHEDWVDWYAWR